MRWFHTRKKLFSRHQEKHISEQTMWYSLYTSSSKFIDRKIHEPWTSMKIHKHRTNHWKNQPLTMTNPCHVHGRLLRWSNSPRLGAPWPVQETIIWMCLIMGTLHGEYDMISYHMIWCYILYIYNMIISVYINIYILYIPVGIPKIAPNTPNTFAGIKWVDNKVQRGKMTNYPPVSVLHLESVGATLIWLVFSCICLVWGMLYSSEIV